MTATGYPGAVRVADIVPGEASSTPTNFTRVGNLVLFRVRPDLALSNWELWVAPVSALSLECSDGIDDDGDGLVDFDGGAAANGGVPLGLPDPGCFDGSLISTEASPCQNGLSTTATAASTTTEALRRTTAPRSRWPIQIARSPGGTPSARPCAASARNWRS